MRAHVTRPGFSPAPSAPRDPHGPPSPPPLVRGGGVSTRPALLGKMAAPSWGVLRLRVRGSGQGVGSLLCLVPKPFCTAAAASKPLDAQQLAERLRAQKQEEKAKKEPVSPEGKTTVPKRQCALGSPGGRGSSERMPVKVPVGVGECGESGGRGLQLAVPSCGAGPWVLRARC